MNTYKLAHTTLLRLAFAFMLLGSVGCNSLLHTDNDGLLWNDQHYRTGNEVNSALIGLYAQLQAVAPQVVLYNELRGDLVVPTPAAPAHLQQIAQGNITADNDYTRLRDFYRVIASCNDILERMNQVISMDPSYTPLINAQYRAEVIGVRSWTFFQILKIAGEISYYTNTLHQVSDVPQVEKLQELRAIQQLLADVTPQLSLFQVTYSSSISNDWRVARFNRFAGAMLHAELNLYAAAYDHAQQATYARQAADNLWLVLSADSLNTSLQQYKVGSTYGRTNWKNIFAPLSTSYNEVIWAIDYSKTNEQTQPLHALFFTEAVIAPSDYALSLFASSDPRAAASIKEGKVYKFSQSKSFYESDAPIVLYRAADLHLLYAESVTILGNAVQAAKVLNKGYSEIELLPNGSILYNPTNQGVRGRLGLADAPASTVAQAEASIRAERQMELAFEGKRWESLLRYALMSGANDITVRGVTFTKDKWYVPLN